MGANAERMAGGKGGIKFTWDKLRFDSNQIKKRISKAQINFFRHFGATVRMYARRSMRRKEKKVVSKEIVRKDGRPFMVYPVSEPGKPPLAHEGGIRDGIRFAWDVTDASVVVGPPPAGQRIAHLMEHGGTHKVRVFYETSPTGKILADFRKVRAQTVTYQPRPFMQPAFAANLTAERLAFFFEGKGLDKAFEKSVRKQIKVVE